MIERLWACPECNDAILDNNNNSHRVIHEAYGISPWAVKSIIRYLCPHTATDISSNVLVNKKSSAPEYRSVATVLPLS